MKVSSLSSAVLAKLKSWRWDRFIEKHEGPERWRDTLKYAQPEFMLIAGRYVLLPVDREHHPHITIIRCIVGDDQQTLTVFLKDTTYVDDPRKEFLYAGYMAVCDRFQGEDFYVAILYHEWFMVQNEG